MRTKRPISFEEAKARYQYRFTMEHVPNWARAPFFKGKMKVHYAPQFVSDREWYDTTTFPGEGDVPKGESHCYSRPTWPLGTTLLEPFVVRRPAPTMRPINITARV